MLATLFVLAALAPQGSNEAPPLLVAGETFEGRITDADPQVHTPTLDADYATAPTVGQTLRIEVDKAGPYTIELRSWVFDAYLVLRDESGVVLAEDDDGLLGTHARVVLELEAERIYFLDVCSLHGGRGAFELRFVAWQIPPVPLEGAEATIADLHRCIEFVCKIEGPDSEALADVLNQLVSLLSEGARYEEARPFMARALAIREKVLGPEHPDTAASMTWLAYLLEKLGDCGAARPLFERALAIRERVLGPEHPDTADSLNYLALLLKAQGDYAAARRLCERALAIREKAFGPEHPETAMGLHNLAAVLKEQGDYAAALPHCERALSIWERTLGPEHPDTAAGLDLLARLLQARGDLAAARPVFERALAIREEALGPEHTDTAWSLDSLGSLLSAQGDCAAARPLLERALAIREKVLGPEHFDTASSQISLACLLLAQGDYAAARPLLDRALAILESSLGFEHINTAATLLNLARLLILQGDFASARSLLERAQAIAEKVLGQEHPAVASCLVALADILRRQRDYAAARPLLERALVIREAALGSEHPDTAASLNSLACLLAAQGDLAASRPLLEHSLAILESVLGFEHPNTSRCRFNLGSLLADQGYCSEAARQALVALGSSLGHARKSLWPLSERERLSFLRGGEDYQELCLSASTWPGVERLEAEAYELSLAWRGLVSRSLLAGRERLRAQVGDGAPKVLAELQQVQSDLSQRLYARDIANPDAHEVEIRSLSARRNDLEVELQRLAGPSTERAVTLSELQGSLNEGTAFLDFLVHSLYVPAELDGERVVRRGRWTEEHLSAWIVRADRELVRIDLGLAAPIEAAVKDGLREIISTRGVATGEQGGASGKNLRELLWTPLVSSLEGVTRVFVGPDSFLGTLPFETIPLEGGRFLIEDKDFVYVQTPLDLVERRKDADEVPHSLLTVGGVDFQKRAQAPEAPQGTPVVASAARGDELRGSLNQFWGRLPNSEYEAQVVHDLFAASFAKAETLALGADQPTEERLKQELPRHAYLHIATHGFFHPAGTVSMWDSAREQLDKDTFRGLDDETHALVGQLPGLLPGLVCAGANTPAPEGRDDGLLTAEEVLWLDLSHVELVVLSACETALGERRSGEGMIGLRRAFGLAGAKTVVSSLWSVKDRSTSELMQRFYENLWLKKQGRADALRNAQLEMLAKNRATEGDALPSTWGAFVLNGEWR